MFLLKKENSNIRLPSGFRDILPVESAERNEIKKIIGSIFRSWGYGEIKTPVMEYTENISIGVGKSWKEKLINFIDTDGSLISLRTDMTIPVARLAGMRLNRNQLPARFCYFSDVFRQKSSQTGDKRVFSQAGLEFLGSAEKLDADLEILIIMIRILKSLGLDEFKAGIGHIGFIRGLFEWLGIDNDKKAELKKYIVNKDFVMIGSFLDKIDRSKKKIFMSLMQPENDIKRLSEIAAEINNEEVSEVFKYLRDLCNMLEEQGYGKYIIFDFSIIKEFDYYTGLLFEIYSTGITDTIGSGGRYDGLIRKFGANIPATGFALDIDTLHGSLGDRQLVFEKKIMLADPGRKANMTELINIADKIRNTGTDVEILIDGVRDIKSIAVEKGCTIIAEALKDLSKIKVTYCKNGNIGIRSINSFLEELKKWKKN
jgi:ATP phosphoribosyltransferase regulatory subunit